MFSNKFPLAVSTLIGTVVGIGVFGVPFAFMKAGFLTGIFFLVLTLAVTLVLNLAYGEVALRTRSKHQITGYTDIYLGSKWKKLALFAITLGIYSALLVYIIISGEFLTNTFSNIFTGISPFGFSILFFIALSLALAGGLRTASRFEFFMTILFIGVVLAIVGLGFSKIELSNITIANREFFFLPYGILLFALHGLPAIPMVREILGGKENKLKKAIIYGTVIPAVIYLLFAFVIVGISGDTTTPEAVAGLFSALGFNVVFLVSLFGLLVISTSFVGLGMALLEVFRYDFHLSKFTSWLLVVMPPLVLFLTWTRDFITVINLAGAVAVGIESILFIFLYQKIKKKGQRIPEYSMALPKWVWYAMIILFSVGITYTLVY